MLESLPEFFDVNCAVGDWPFRRVPCNTVERLLARMDRLHIRRAAVSRLENVFYKDVLAGNRELATLIAPYRDRLLPLYVVNPAFPGWEQDLALCIEELGLQPGHGGLRLYPSYHAYALDGKAAAVLLARAQQLRLPVVVSARLEDERTHHWLCRVPPVSPERLVAAISAYPQVRWIVAGLRAPQIRGVWQRLRASGFGDELQVAFDLSLVQGPVDECALLVQDVGTTRLAFGTNLPLTQPESPVLAVQHADLPATVKVEIAAGNAARVLGARA